MAEEKVVEHHWHDPTQGQVTKAMLQHFHDMGLSREELIKLADKKIGEAVQGAVDRWVNSGKFDELLVAAVANHVANKREVFDRKGGYGLVNHVRNLIDERLKTLLVDKYEVTLTERKKG